MSLLASMYLAGLTQPVPLPADSATSTDKKTLEAASQAGLTGKTTPLAERATAHQTPDSVQEKTVDDFLRLCQVLGK